MGFINRGRLNIRKRNSCASALISLSDVQPPSVYKSHILNGPINKLYVFYLAAIQCEDGNEYQVCVDPCPQTCENIGQPRADYCDVLVCNGGCECPENYVRNGNYPKVLKYWDT